MATTPKGVNWLKEWKPKTWPYTGAALKKLKDAYKAKAVLAINNQIEKLFQNAMNGTGKPDDQAVITGYTPIKWLPSKTKGKSESYTLFTTITPGAKEVPDNGPGSGLSHISPQPPPQP